MGSPLRAKFVPYEALPGRYQDVRIRIPDNTKARQLLGLEPQVGLEEGLARTVGWHQSRRVAEEAVGA